MGYYTCRHCEKAFLNYEFYQTHLERCHKMPIIEPIRENPILTEVQALLATQTEKGLKKYGTTVNVDDYSVIGWIDHILEEKCDEIVYLVTLKHKLKKMLG